MSRNRCPIASRRATALHVWLVAQVASIGCQPALDLDRYAFNDETAPETPAMEGDAGLGGAAAASGLGDGRGGGSLSAAGAAATGVETLGGVPGVGGGSRGGCRRERTERKRGSEMAPQAMGGTGPGAGGGTGSGAGPLPSPGNCQDDGVWQIEYTDRSGPSESEMSMRLDVQYTDASIPRSDLVFLYWFNADGHIDFTADVDYVAIDGVAFTDRVTVSFGAALASHYGDIGFIGMDGELVSGARIQVRLHTGSYDALDQSNDFSYVAGADRISNPNIAVYVDGALAGGCEPAPL